MSGLLKTKLHCPSIPPKRVYRPHLIQRLNEGLESGRKLTLVSAPAGFGKTTCICEWVISLDLQVSWLSLDQADDDPGRFFTYLTAALQSVDEHLGLTIENIFRTGQLPPIETISTTLSNDIMELEKQFLLVLDDFQVIQDRFILQVLEKLAVNLPQPLHLVLLTREDPLLPLARLRANNLMTEIRAGDLRFTDHEIADFMNEVMGLCLSTADIALLEDRTEGWIVGLQLAGLSIRDRANPSGFIAALSGSHRFILSYLTEEVLDRQPVDIQHFLLQTSILDRLNGDLCNTVTGRTDSGAILEKLFTANLFLIPLDDEQHWYRYHHLFADLLVNRLKQTRPVNVIQKLHSLAREWLAQNELIDEAIKHALEGKDYERAISLVEPVARTMIFTGRLNTLRHWLEAIPEPTHPRLNLYRIWIDFMQGKTDLSAPALQEKEKMLRALPPSPENDRLRIEMMVLLSPYLALAGDTSGAIRIAEEVLKYLPEEDLGSRARVISAISIAYGAQGNVDKAVQAYHESIRLAKAASYYSLAAHTMVLMAQWLCYYGKLREAAHTYQAIIDMEIESGQKVFYSAGQGYIGLAGICLEWRDLETAEDYLQKGLELCRQGGVDDFFPGCVIKARLRQAKGDFTGALDEIHLLDHALPRSDSFTAVIRHILIELGMGNIDSAYSLAEPLLTALADNSITPKLPLMVLESFETILIRVFLAKGELENALQLLDQLQGTAEPGKRLGRLIEVYLLRAMALEKQNKGNITNTVLEHFKRALDLAIPEDYFLLFLEEGPAVSPLLNAVVNHPSTPDRLKKYARKLIDGFPSDCKTMTVPVIAANGINGLIEALTDRELEVLRLMADGLKYEEIADKLFVSINTIRSHVKAIYSKLDMNNRTKAIEKAKQLQLL